MNETTHTEALRILSSPSPCYAKAIRNLKRLAVQDPRALADLSAAYSLRAQRTDEPADLLPAMQYALEAVDKTPRSFVARFNLALCQEALGMDEDAIRSWDLLRAANHGSWSTEAAEHRQALAKKLADAAVERWPAAKAQLGSTEDQKAIARVVDAFPAAAQRYVEEELLPGWDLRRARAIAEALWKRNGDRYVLDVVEAAERSNGTLRQAHADFGKARASDRAFEFKTSESSYLEALKAFELAKSPMAIGVRLRLAVAASVDGRKPDAAEIERLAVARNYKQLAGHARSTRANGLLWINAPQSADLYEQTRAWFAGIDDLAAVADAHRGRAGAFWYSGDLARAWSEMFHARRHSAHSAELQSWHHIFGQSGEIAAELGYPRIARDYQQRVIARVRQSLFTAPPDRPDYLAYLQRNLSAALRKNAAYEARLNRIDHAMRDIDEALRLAGQARDERDPTRNAFVARAQEVAGQIALSRKDALAAVRAFTTAIDRGANEYPTFVANLYAQRAAAYLSLEDTSAAEKDLETALQRLREEETRMLASRTPGEGEHLLVGYFSRFRQTHDQLIRLYAASGRARNAFELAERARAIEPLDLLLRQNQFIPEAFVHLAGQPVGLNDIQRLLPENTYLIQYRLQDAETHVWVIGRDQFEALTLEVRRQEVGDWSGQLYAAAANPRHYDALAGTIYDALVAPALARIPAQRRLVFIPDGPLHAIPIGALRNGGRYLIETERIAFAGSARLYLWSVERDRAMKHSGAPSILLIGDPTNDLSYAAREVADIQRFYERHHMLMGQQATATAVLNEAPGHAVVHIAAHAVANAESPFQSFIRLAAGSELQAQQLVTRLKADNTRLFVLSACSSAGGSPVGPEGVAPLVRPIIAAGVPAVVGSLWTVDDPAARSVMVPFHRHLSQGHDAADALRLAQLDLLEGNEAERSVLTWGSFQVIGHATSPFRAPHLNSNQEKPSP